jgi:hypothetical protein
MQYKYHIDMLNISVDKVNVFYKPGYVIRSLRELNEEKSRLLMIEFNTVLGITKNFENRS